MESSPISSAVPFALSESFFLLPFHIESIASTILCIVSRFLAYLASFRLIKSCLRLRSRSPVHAFYGPMHSGYCAQPPGTSLKTGNIEPSFGRFLTVRFSFRCSPYFDNRQISIPLFPVRNQVISTKDAACPGFYPAMFKERSFRVYIHRLCKPDIVLNPISQSPLVRLQPDKEITAFFPDFIYDGFLEGHGVRRNYASRHIHLVQQFGHGSYLVAFFLRTCPWQV